jgi:protein O-mannosyl-transferase
VTDRSKTFAAAMILFIAAVLLYAPTLSFDLLQWDDQYHLTTNPFLQPDSPDRFAHFWREPYGNLYVPVTYNLWALIYGWSLNTDGTLSTWGLHATNAIVHAINATLVFFVLRKLTPGRTHLPSLLGTFLFIVHPLQVESVAWISELRGLLAAMFALLATSAHLSGPLALWERVRVRAFTHPTEAERTSVPHPGPLPEGEAAAFARSFVTLVPLALGLLCKPSVAMMPIVWVVLDRLILRRSWKTVGVSLGLPMLLVAGSLWSMRMMQGGTHLDAGATWQRPFIAADALAFYGRQFFWPFGLAADYSRTPRVALETGTYATGANATATLSFVILVVVFLVLWRRRRRSDLAAMLFTSLLIFAAALLPVLGLVPFDFQRISTVADRYAYLALLGPAWFVARFVRGDRLWVGVTVALLGLLAWRNLDQQRTWQNDATLWTHAAKVNPRAIVALSNLAHQADQRGDDAEARRLYERVIRLAPERGNGYRGLAKLSLDAGDTLAALSFYQQAVAHDPNDAFAWEGAASMFAALDRPNDAEPAYRRALEIDPRFSDAWNNLAALFIEEGRYQDAAAALERAVAIHPRHPRAWANLALVKDANGDAIGAAAALDRAERLHGIDAGVRRLLIARAMRRQDWPSSERWLRQNLRGAPQDVSALNDLGQVLAAAGRVDEAIATFESAVALRPDLGVLKENLESARRLKAMGP